MPFDEPGPPSAGAPRSRLRLHGCSVDLGRQQVSADDGTVRSLTTKESELLGYLAARPGRDVSRAELLEQVWGYHASTRTRTVDTLVKTLRRKVERDPAHPEHVVTVHGFGYRFVPAPEVGSIVGRRAPIERLRRHVEGDGPPLITIVGPGGAGKTRLAHHVVARWPPAGGAAWVELPAEASVEAVEAALSTAAGLPAGPGRRERLRAWLEARSPLSFVLDDAEGAVGALRELWPALRLPGVRWIATSRVPLGVPDEELLPLGGLPAAEAETLLRERARMHGVALTEPVVELVERLDGLPLALELAAARLGLLTPSQLVAQLDAPLDVVGRPGTDRRASLRRVVAWSWGLLDPEARRHLAWLGTFAADFDLVAAGAVLDLEGPELLDALATLVGASMLHAMPPDSLPERRFRLWGAVRAFAAERLALDEARDAVTLRHAAWHADNTLAWARRAVGPDGELPLQRLQRAMPDTRALPDRVRPLDAVLASRVAIGGLLPFRIQALDTLATPLIDRAVADAADDDAALADALLQRVHLRRARGALDEAEADLIRLEALADGDRLRGHAARARGGLAVARGRLEAAVEAYAAARPALLASGDAQGAAVVLSDRAAVLGWLGRREEAVAALKAAATELASCGSAVDRCLVLANLASEERELGRREASAVHARSALRLAREARYASVEGQASAVLAQLAADAGDLDEAAALLQRARALFREAASPGLEALAAAMAAELAALAGRVHDAEEALEAVQSLEARVPGAYRTLLGLAVGRALIASNRPHEAAATLAEVQGSEAAVWRAWLAGEDLPVPPDQAELVAVLGGGELPDVAPLTLRIAAYSSSR